MDSEDLLTRQMPHSLEGEQAVLGSMLIDPDCIKCSAGMSSIPWYSSTKLLLTRVR